MIWLLLSVFGIAAAAGGSGRSSDTVAAVDDAPGTDDAGETFDHSNPGGNTSSPGSTPDSPNGHGGSNGSGDSGSGSDSGSGHGHGDGHGGGHDHDPVPLPTTSAEIQAFVDMIRMMGETHVHDASSTLHGEHMMMLDLVPRSGATHIAIADGDWDDPSIWHNGEVPGDDAKVLIPEGATVSYGFQSDARLFTVRVDGKLEFETDTDSKMVVDTFVVSPSGTLEIGTEANPIQANVDVDIVIANNGAIDTDWDPTLLSRGMISHGDVTIHGAAKDSHEKVSTDPMKGDTSVTFEELPIGWQVGDTIVIAGTNYEGYRWDNDIRAVRFYEPEDEERVISRIEGDTVHFDEPLIHDHDAPRSDLSTSVANYTRNISIETENSEDAEVFERGHVMFMHSDNVDVRYAEFHELGRTDKSVDVHGVNGETDIEFDSNVKGRYGLHLHRLGTQEQEDPAIVIGNAVYGSPGWGFVHHDSHAILDNNASYDTFGAGFVSESGNETGAWTDNIAIFAQGVSWGAPKNEVNLEHFDTGNTGDGFWFQSRLVESSDNVAASVNHGYVYFHRGPLADDGQLTFDADNFAFSEALYFGDTVSPDDASILHFDDNEAFAANNGLHVVKSNPNQGHDVHSVISDFTAWSVKTGVALEYTSHYVLDGLDLIAVEREQFDDPRAGVGYGTNTTDIVLINSKIEGFETGVFLHKNFSANSGRTSPEDDGIHDYFVINTEISDTTTHYLEFDPVHDTIIPGSGPAEVAPSISIDGQLTYKEGDGFRVVEIDGTKTDSLGTTTFPNGTDNFDLYKDDVINVLENNGYYTASDGNTYFTLDLFFSDRMTGDVYKQTELVRVDPNVPLGYTSYENAVYHGDIQYSDLLAMKDAGPQLVIDQSDEDQFFAPLELHLSGLELMEVLGQGQGVLSDTQHSQDDHSSHDDMMMTL